MDEPATHPAAEIEALKAAYAALNRKDIAGFVQSFDPQIERDETDLPQGGIHRGIDAVTAHVAQAREGWAEGTCEPERFIVAGDRVVVIAQVHVRLKTETDWRDGRTADVFTFRDGKVIHYRTFADPEQALEWTRAPES